MSADRNGPAATHLLAYRRELMSRPDSDADYQLWLKRRVLATYANLLDMNAGGELSDGKLLDTGSADGSFAKACGEIGLTCHNLDADQGIDFERDRFPFSDRSFRFVNSNSVIEHLRDPANYLKEIRRTMTDDGYLFLVTPHWPYAWKEFYDSYTHYQPYSYKALRGLLRAYGFEPLALVPWLVMKSRLFWQIPAPASFWIAKNLLFFRGTTARAPSFLRGKSSTLLCLARKSGDS